jgi:FHS family L-fucose permease-like MFS transporter
MRIGYRRKITVSDDTVTSAVHLTLKQSLVPCFLGDLPFIIWSGLCG